MSVEAAILSPTSCSAAPLKGLDIRLEFTALMAKFDLFSESGSTALCLHGDTTIKNQRLRHESRNGNEALRAHVLKGSFVRDGECDILSTEQARWRKGDRRDS